MALCCEDAIRIAILIEPSAFGYTHAEVNPMLMYTLRRDDPEFFDLSETESWIECFETVQRLLAEVVFGVLNDAKKKRKDEIVELAEAHSDISPQDEPPELPTAKKRGNGKRPAGALTVKQLRYVGYLYRKLGEEPEYDEISSLTQSQATVRIKELEQRVNG